MSGLRDFRPGGRRRSTEREANRDLAAEVLAEPNLELWHDAVGRTYASMEIAGHVENWPISSREFRQRITLGYFAKHRRAPSSRALQDALATIEASAMFEGRLHVPAIRVGRAGECIYVDMADDAWRAIEVSRDGWTIVSRPPVRFIRSSSMRPLPEPIHDDGGIDLLRSFVNVESDEDFHLLVGWLVGAFNPDGPYLVLMIRGEQGSAKTTTARILRELIDPNDIAGASLPSSERDVAIATQHERAMFYDNASSLPPWLSDFLARIATGAGFSTRKLHSDADLIKISACRPQCINGIPSIVNRPDLASRSIFVNLAPIPDHARRLERDLWARFAEHLPAILGALLDGVSSALRRLATIKLDAPGRMADAEAWITAAEPGLGWKPGTFSGAYRANRDDASSAAIEGSVVGTAIEDLMKRRNNEPYVGSATELLDELNHVVTEMARRGPGWPRNARALSDALSRVTPALRGAGIDVVRNRDSGHQRKRLIAIKVADTSGGH